MTYSVRPLACNTAILDGLSTELINRHYDEHYRSDAQRLDLLRAELARLDWSNASSYVIKGLKQDELVAANSALLHELYFETLGNSGPLKPGGLSVAFARDFGSFDRWSDEFAAIGKSLGDRPSWVLCSWSTRENRLVNQWADDSTGLLGSATPVLALDMYEHAYTMDFGVDAGSYVGTFIRNIDWEKANARYAAVVEHATGSLALTSNEFLQNQEDIMLVDVRRAGAFQASKAMITNATWLDPEQVATWSEDLPTDKPVVVYCVFGHEVGQATAAILHARGIDAKFLVGGIHDWVAEGRPTQSK